MVKKPSAAPSLPYLICEILKPINLSKETKEEVLKQGEELIMAFYELVNNLG